MGLMAPFSVTFYGFLVVSLFFKETESCPMGWMRKKDHCYSVFNDAVKWTDAEINCAKKKSHLASIHSMTDMMVIADYVKKNVKSGWNVWIGLRTKKGTRNWEWADNTSATYFSWDDGEPNNYLYRENCVELSAKKDYIRWNDKRCSKHQPYLCQRVETD